MSKRRPISSYIDQTLYERMERLRKMERRVTTSQWIDRALERVVGEEEKKLEQLATKDAS